MLLVPLDRFLGCLIGQAVGDGLGAPYEGLSPDVLYHMCGPSRSSMIATFSGLHEHVFITWSTIARFPEL